MSGAGTKGGLFAFLRGRRNFFGETRLATLFVSRAAPTFNLFVVLFAHSNFQAWFVKILTGAKKNKFPFLVQSRIGAFASVVPVRGGCGNIR